jgi:hypothetical protein
MNPRLSSMLQLTHLACWCFYEEATAFCKEKEPVSKGGSFDLRSKYAPIRTMIEGWPKVC